LSGSAPGGYSRFRTSTDDPQADMCGDGTIRGTWCAFDGDDSPALLGDRYSSRCGACYQGHPHSVAYHQRQLEVTP
jgi:hypothetical protein